VTFSSKLLSEEDSLSSFKKEELKSSSAAAASPRGDENKTPGCIDDAHGFCKAKLRHDVVEKHSWLDILVRLDDEKAPEPERLINININVAAGRIFIFARTIVLVVSNMICDNYFSRLLRLDFLFHTKLVRKARL
jgi:hypothetical protein